MSLVQFTTTVTGQKLTGEDASAWRTPSGLRSARTRRTPTEPAATPATWPPPPAFTRTSLVPGRSKCRGTSWASTCPATTSNRIPGRTSTSPGWVPARLPTWSRQRCWWNTTTSLPIRPSDQRWKWWFRPSPATTSAGHHPRTMHVKSSIWTLAPGTGSATSPRSTARRPTSPTPTPTGKVRPWSVSVACCDAARETV